MMKETLMKDLTAAQTTNKTGGLGKRLLVLTRAASTTLRTCVSTVTIAEAAQRRHGLVSTVRSCIIPKDFARIVISQDTIAQGRSKRNDVTKRLQSSATVQTLWPNKCPNNLAKTLKSKTNLAWQFCPTHSSANGNTPKVNKHRVMLKTVGLRKASRITQTQIPMRILSIYNQTRWNQKWVKTTFKRNLRKRRKNELGKTC